MKKRYYGFFILAIIVIAMLVLLPNRANATENNVVIVRRTHDIGFRVDTTCSIDTTQNTIDVFVQMSGPPIGTNVIVEKTGVSIFLQSTNSQFDNLLQYKVDNENLQDGWSIDDTFEYQFHLLYHETDDYKYQQQFIIEEPSEDLELAWQSYAEALGLSDQLSLNNEPTDENLIKYADVYAKKIQISYTILFKFPNEEYFSEESFSSVFVIPIANK